jgi:hypothetical protein
VIALKTLDYRIVQDRVDSFNSLPEGSTAPVKVDDFQLFAEGLVCFRDTDTKTFIPIAEQRLKAIAALTELELALANITDYYARVAVEVNAGKAFKDSCTTSISPLDYSQSESYSLEGLKLVADGVYYKTGKQYDTPQVQRLKAEALLAAAVVPEETAERMWFGLDIYSTWLDSIVNNPSLKSGACET